PAGTRRRCGTRQPAADRAGRTGGGRGAQSGTVRDGPARRAPGNRCGVRPCVRADRWHQPMSTFEAAALFAVALSLAVAGFIVLTTYNDVVALRQRIDKAWANVDVALKQRRDELTNLVHGVRD